MNDFERTIGAPIVERFRCIFHGRRVGYGADMARSAWLDIDWPAHTHRAIVDGSQMNYVDIGSGPPLVFVHGLGGSWQNWLENLPHFAKTHRCIAPDLGGFGESEPLEGEVSIERYARSLHELLGQLGIESAPVIGNSMGGFIALDLAIRHPELVERLVLVSAAVLWQEYRRAKPLVVLANVTEGTLGRLLIGVQPRLATRPRLRETALRFGGFAKPRKLPRELQRELILTARRTEGFLPGLKALADYPLREELAEVKIPTLIVWGDADPLVGVSHAKELESLISGSRAVVYERTGHVVQAERPERFNADVEEFLAGDRALGGAGDQPGVLGEHAVG
jgi:pimeloyl-ACP methyl ester carboxylesterase